MRDSVRRLAGRVIVAALAGVVGLAGLAASTALSQDRTCVWRVSSPTSSVYLLGSIHLLTGDDYPLPEEMEKVFDDADAVVFEVNPDSLQSPALQTYVLVNAMYEEGKTLKSELGDSVYARAHSMAESLGVNLDLMNAYKPWFVSLSLPLIEMQRLGFRPELGVELHFAEKAKRDGKTVLALETARYQVDLFVTLDEERQRDLLIHTLSQLSDVEKDLAKLVEAWKKGDLAAVENTVNRSLGEYPDIHERFLLQRNRNWVEQILEFLNDDRDYVVIVGVGHMPGDEGLIRLLQRRGYDVEQM